MHNQSIYLSSNSLFCKSTSFLVTPVMVSCPVFVDARWVGVLQLPCAFLQATKAAVDFFFLSHLRTPSNCYYEIRKEQKLSSHTSS